MIIDHKNKFIFIAIPKTASTSITKRFGLTIDKPPEEYHMKLREIPNLKNQFNNYFKFCFVRNPYDRLMCAYHDLSSSAGHLKWSYPILKYKSFTEFVKNFHSSPCKNFIHLLPQHEFINIDNDYSYISFIGKFENLEIDFKKIENKLKINHQPLFHLRRGKYHQNKLNIFEKFLLRFGFFDKKKINFMDAYTPETKNICYQTYKKDFEIFGYEK